MSRRLSRFRLQKSANGQRSSPARPPSPADSPAAIDPILNPHIPRNPLTVHLVKLYPVCRKCIYKKLSDEESECCPICNIDLGCVPLEKLRPDHNLQDVRAKVFPYKRQKVKAPEVVPSVTLPVRRKERSLSSLVVSTPRVSAQSGMTGRRSKSIARKPLRGSTFSIEKLINKEEGSAEDQPENSTSPETLDKFTQNVRQNVTNAEPDNHPTPNKETENDAEQWKGKVDMWRPLNCLVEAANRSKSSRFMPQGSAVKSEPSHVADIDGHARKTKVKEHGHKLKVQDEKTNSGSTPLESEKPKKLRRIRKKAPSFGDFNIFPNAVIDNASAKFERRINPIWFSLVASQDQEGDAPLPQISANYLRIKDGSIPVSFIQKYLVRKLDLMSDDEVEIRCMGQSIVPTLQLNNLVDLWLQTASSDRIPAKIGTSAKEFVMVLVYGRRVPAS
nr:E3 ubiquitin protein ligase DRIP2-like [Ipomoea batatas]